MARVVPGPPPGKEVEYVPAFENNRADPDPVRAFFIAPSNADRRALYASPENPFTIENATGADLQRWREKILGTLLQRVENYRDPDGVPIVTAADLAERGELPLFVELYSFASDLLTLSGEAVKPSAGPQDSSPQAIRLSNGTAASADDKASTSPATADPSQRTLDSNTTASAQA